MTRRILLFTSTCLLLLAGVCPGQSGSRSFLMGFTPFPHTKDDAGYTTAFQRMAAGGDMVHFTFQEGMPWNEALASSDYRTYPVGLRNTMEMYAAKYQQYTPGHKKLVSFLPISIDYLGLALNYATGTRPSPWNTYTFASPQVKQACLNYATALIEFYKPQYFAVGVEVNILMARRWDLWPGYKELHQYMYQQLKAKYPSLIVFTTIQYEHMLGQHTWSQQFLQTMQSTYPQVLWAEVYYLLADSDALVLSTYPYLTGQPLTLNHFDLAIFIAYLRGKPIGIEQTGWISQNVSFGGLLFPGSAAAQSNYMSFLLSLAQVWRFLFVINFVPQDYAYNLGKDAITQSWGWTGLWEETGVAKPALSVWNGYRALPKQ